MTDSSLHCTFHTYEITLQCVQWPLMAVIDVCVYVYTGAHMCVGGVRKSQLQE